MYCFMVAKLYICSLYNCKNVENVVVLFISCTSNMRAIIQWKVQAGYSRIALLYRERCYLVTVMV